MLYLVRWPDLTAAVVNAKDERDLLCILDEVASIAGCRWRRYTAPLYIEFDLGGKWRMRDRGGRLPVAEDIIVERVSERRLRHPRVALRDIDASEQFLDALFAFAFPHFAKLLDGNGPIKQSALLAAAREELQLQLQAAWRTEAEARSDDPIAAAARALRTTIAATKALLPSNLDSPAPERPRGKRLPFKVTRNRHNRDR